MCHPSFYTVPEQAIVMSHVEEVFCVFCSHVASVVEVFLDSDRGCCQS